ncbi:hypothetical protein XAP6164_4500009 [Xanthomonas phaseoli pv. phaseoli]|nr:hypothetical protein XAP6164_4500009 [Xanthomonas phaseoli pv. phaseoli]
MDENKVKVFRIRTLVAIQGSPTTGIRRPHRRGRPNADSHHGLSSVQSRHAKAKSDKAY